MQAQPASARGRDYSFTISALQPWTDTGVDLRAGDTLTVTASAAEAAGCDPAGISGTREGSTTFPIVNAPAGALIARLEAQGVPVLVGTSKHLKVEGSGHLYFGVNGQATPPCNGSFSVKVQIIGTDAESAPGNAPVGGSAPPSEASPPAGSSSEPTIKSKLASAAQVFLAGQFGKGSTSAAPASDVPAGSSAVSANPTAPASAASALTPKLSTIPLDSSLQKDLEGLPRRVNDEFQNQGDMVNFVLIGSEQQVKTALEAASWHIADTDTKEALLKAALQTYQKKDYLQMPMSQLYLFGRRQDYGYELAEAYSVVASRHHFRVWKAPFTWKGKTVWAGAGTHDIGFEKDQRNGKVTHKIDPAVDGERDNVGSTLQKAGKAESLSYYLPPDAVQDARNATGGGYHSDGRILVIQLQ